MVISHIKNTNGEWILQDNEAHQNGVAQLASEFASSFDMAKWGRVLGQLHDKGKEQSSFQQYIKKESGYDPSIRFVGPHQHAFVGGLVAKKKYPSQWPILSNAIAGHHRGLYDCDELLGILNKDIPQDVTMPAEITPLSMPALQYQRKDFHHLQRMLFSCLVDADYLDTEAFMQPEQARMRENGKASMQQLLATLEEHFARLRSNSPDTEVNRIRNYVQTQCREKSNQAIGFYSLTVPTGGGKTLSSLLWALKHAVHNGQKRIIIAIPYTSIITQTAAILKSIFGEENVLEHHSEFDYNEIDRDSIKESLRLATENWDYPIIVTTNVQLFESLFSNRPSHCRKLHNIAKSVIILDEVQTLPLTHLQPIVDSLDTLNRIFNTSILFTTASQPILSGEIVGCNPTVHFEALPSITEVIPPEAMLHEKLRRVELSFDNTPRTYDEIADEIVKHKRILCIVNTRKDAKELYDRLPDEGLTLHLSRMMYPEHVKRTIEQIRHALTDPKQEVIRIISTQLIEAGVDIDFPVVFRQEAGLDSVLQAAGRCNREGKMPNKGKAWVFSIRGSNQLPPGYISHANDARLGMGNDHDWFAPESMTLYFKQLQSRNETFDAPQMKSLLYNKPLQFEEASKVFHLIDDNTTPVVVKCDESQPLIENLEQFGPSYGLMKKLRRYSVNIRMYDLVKLSDSGAISRLDDDSDIFILNPGFYNEKTGLTFENEWINETLII